MQDQVAQDSNKEVDNDSNKNQEKVWSRKKGWLMVLGTFIFTGLLTGLAAALFWSLLYSSVLVTTEDEATNVMVALLEEIGRQNEIAQNNELLFEVVRAGLSEECLSDPICQNEAIDAVITLQANIENQKNEIANLWLKGTVAEDFASFYQYAESENQIKLDKIVELYFPQELEDLETSTQLL